MASIPNPTTDEIMKIRRTHYTGAEQMIADLQMNIQYPASKILQAVFCRAFAEVMMREAAEPDISLNRLMNKGVYLLCWIKRYQGQLFKNWKKNDTGCFIHMGSCRSVNEVLL